MPFHEGFTDEEQLVVRHFLSRGWSRKDILSLLIAKLAKNHSDLEVEQMITEYNVKRKGHGANLLANCLLVVRIELMNIRLEDETTILNGEPEREKIVRDLPDMRRDPARGPCPAMHSANPAGVPAIAIGFAASPNPPIPVILAPMNPTIAAFSPFAPGPPGGLPVITQDPALLGTMFDGPRGTLYERNPPRGGPQLTYPGQIPSSGKTRTSDSEFGNGGDSGGGNTRGGDMSRESGTGGKDDSGSSGDGKDQGRDGGS